MSNGIIVVDIPERCVDCDFCRVIYEAEACCEMTIDPNDHDCLRMIEEYNRSKPDWCPIKSLPDHKEVDLFPADRGMLAEMSVLEIGKQIGWNECLDEILNKQKLSVC